MSNMRVGSLVFATDQGLGILAKSFYDAGLLTDVLVVKHSRYPNHPSWYKNSDGSVPGIISTRAWKHEYQLIRRLMDRVDAMLYFETPFYWDVFDVNNSPPSYLIPMYECMPKTLPKQPTGIICPSLLDLQYYFSGIFIPVPVSVSWRLRERALTFVHNAGHGGLRNRNGTGELLDALRYVQSPLNLLIRSQHPLKWGVPDSKAKVEVRIGNFPHDTLWDEGDVFVFPDKFNGLSLPIQEARASGMLVMSSARFPATTYLPTAPLIPVSSYNKARVSPSCLEFDEAVMNPREIAKTMDEWYGRDIRDYSLSGLEWAKTMSWDVLMPRYREVLSR